MRGIPNENLYGNSAVFFNSSLPVKALDWDDVVELQLEPFTDMGLTWRDEESFSPDQDSVFPRDSAWSSILTD